MPSKTRKTKHNWPKLRAAFFNEDIDLVTLSKRADVPIGTIRKQAQTEHWHDQRNKLRVEARDAATKAVMREIEQRDGLLKKVEARSVEQVIERSKQTGDRLYTLFRGAVQSVRDGDMRAMKVAVDTWVALDSQMRKVHRIDADEEQPLVNISVMAALPKHVKEAGGEPERAPEPVEVEVVASGSGEDMPEDAGEGPD